ncbi:mechanosensitive ion channel family protein [Bremerella cremea]|uniref:Mechanosensitive ion channel family protein n=1 Tax=Bremerella cremea TaxID=1031537 RepID=A0A368KJ14_9BACT|nr:mechanosensitive ion channel family protein [Bremerella cremea]RCS40553.1 mechanosensitive ion channel family protein [Bremerella cremea]
MARNILRILLCGLLLCQLAAVVSAQALSEVTGGATAEKPAAPPPIDPKLLLRQGSPRATVQTFLDSCQKSDFDTAIECMDFSERPEAQKASQRDLAYELYQLLSTLWSIHPEEVPDKTDQIEVTVFGNGKTGRYVPPDDLEDAQKITLTKGSDGLWRFSAKTIDAINKLVTKYAKQISSREKLEEETGRGDSMPKPTFALWLESQVPPYYRKTQFLLPTYQWICLLLLIFTGYVVDVFFKWLLHLIYVVRFSRSASDEELSEAFKKAWQPIGLTAMALAWYGGLYLFRLPDLFRAILFYGVQSFGVVTAIWTFFRLSDLIVIHLVNAAARRGKKYDDLLLPLLSKSLKTFAVCIGVLMLADSFNLPIVGLLGSLGIGGIAIALAAKDTLSNIFGSLTVMIDRPFEIGDWILTEGVEGTVEKMGLRSTKIRTFNNSLLTVPNSLLITAKVDNMGRRQFRRVNTVVGVQYDTTPEQIDAFCEGIRELIRRQPYTRKDYYQVYLNEFNSSSLDILVNLYFDCNDWSVELRERHRLFVDIVRLAKRLGVQFAFPTQTIHLYQEEAAPFPGADELPEESGRRAAAEIAGPLPMPNERRGLVDFPGPHSYEDIDTRRRKK